MLPYHQRGRGIQLRKVVSIFLGVVGISYSVFVGTAVPVKADVPFAEVFHDFGQFEFVAQGVGTRGNPGDGTWTGAGDITIAIPDTADIKIARLIWTGRSNHYDPDGVLLQVDGGPLNRLTATAQYAQDPWCCNAQQRHESTDITALIQSGTHVYRVSDHEHGMTPTGDFLNYGVGIWLVYEDTSASLGELTIFEGQDSFFRFWTPPRGPHSQVNCADFSPDNSDRNIQTRHLISGIDRQVDIRSNAFWYMTGNGPKPAADSVPGIINQPGAIGFKPLNGYPFQSYATLEWDNFSITNGITIPAGDTWVCFQVESGDSTDLAGMGNVGIPSSGMWDLFAVKAVSAVPSAVSLIDFSVEHVAVNEVNLRWETGTEIDHYGFNLYRSQTNNFNDADLIHFAPAGVVGGSTSGAVYHYVDTNVTDGQWWYWLESIDTNGFKLLEDTLSVVVPRIHQLYLPFVSQ